MYLWVAGKFARKRESEKENPGEEKTASWRATEKKRKRLLGRGRDRVRQ